MKTNTSIIFLSIIFFAGCGHYEFFRNQSPIEMQPNDKYESLSMELLEPKKIKKVRCSPLWSQIINTYTRSIWIYDEKIKINNRIYNPFYEIRGSPLIAFKEKSTDKIWIITCIFFSYNNFGFYFINNLDELEFYDYFIKEKNQSRFYDIRFKENVHNYLYLKRFIKSWIRGSREFVKAIDEFAHLVENQWQYLTYTNEEYEKYIYSLEHTCANSLSYNGISYDPPGKEKWFHKVSYEVAGCFSGE